MHQEAIWDYFQNEGADGFDQALPRMRFLLRHLNPGERVLNIGVGNGNLEALGIEKGVEMWSLDPGERAIERVRAKLNMGDRAQVGYSQKMPFPAGTFDKVVMTEVLEHLDDDVHRQTMDDIARVLKPGGQFIGTVPAREDLSTQTVVCPHCTEKFHRWGHERSFTTASMIKAIGPKFKTTAREEFFTPWDGAGLKQKAASLLKKILSARGVGTYGTSRNIFFVAQRT